MVDEPSTKCKIDAILVTRTDVDDRCLVGRHGLDRNPVKDSVRMLVATPQRMRIAVDKSMV